mmetsp:Transcript_11535/g.35280  ORF Transcript_11535/g.35280 Transcript_11535/m.35280 type:complete len:229 (+) Transcript_11535:6268-6954(+)
MQQRKAHRGKGSFHLVALLTIVHREHCLGGAHRVQTMVAQRTHSQVEGVDVGRALLVLRSTITAVHTGGLQAECVMCHRGAQQRECVLGELARHQRRKRTREAEQKAGQLGGAHQMPRHSCECQVAGRTTGRLTARQRRHGLDQQVTLGRLSGQFDRGYVLLWVAVAVDFAVVSSSSSSSTSASVRLAFLTRVGGHSYGERPQPHEQKPVRCSFVGELSRKAGTVRVL